MVDENLSASEELERSLQYAATAKQSGLETSGKLSQQNESLLAAEDTVEANEYTLQKSMTILRGMTWPGLIYNTIFTAESVKSDLTDRDQNESKTNIQNKESQKQFNEKPNQLFTSQQPNDVDEDEMLKQLLSSVTELEVVGATIGLQIDHQNAIISRIDQKTERVGDQTLAVTLEASILSQRTKNYHDGQVINDNVMLTDNEDRSTLFHCYAKDSALYALQNAKTLKFLSATLWGLSGIQAVGMTFNRREECHMDLDKQSMGLFFLHSNFGYGGWLKKPPVEEIKGAGGRIVNAVTSNVSDKVGILLLRPVPCVLSKEADQERFRRQESDS